ncbi:MAG: DNA methyltransferase [Ignavibacteriaceae bacterium]
MSVPSRIIELVELFDRNIESYKSNNFNETQVRREFLDPFFTELGWDVENKRGYAEAYKDVIHEYSQKTADSVEAPDYCFRIGGTRKFFIEAKKPSVNLKDDIHPAFQLRRYAWSAKLPLSILTDFEEFAVYDCRIPPKKNDKASTARVIYYNYKEYVEKWDDIESIFSREAVLKGSFDKYAETNKNKRGTAEVDDTFLKVIEEWREFLARNIALRNSNLTTRELNYAVQKTIDRIIFLRICEDRGIEEYGQLLNMLNGENVYKRMIQIFTRADEKYNSGLFHFEVEKGRAESPDELTPLLEIDDKILKEIIKNLYYPESPFEFSVLPADILGQVYEQFLGKVIRLTEGHHAVIDDKPEVKKAGGVYYTPIYIVKYIVENTLGKLLLNFSFGTDKEIKNTVKKISEIKVLDPACGSGSFLIEAYQSLLDWHLKIYTSTDETIQKNLSSKNPVIYQAANGEYRLTTGERKRILLNNIYGVDIDTQAVEVTKLSLLLKVLEGESEESLNAQLRMFHERALPDLGDNIKYGNSLIGPDFYNQMEMQFLDDEEKLRINVFDWDSEFREIMDKGGFNVVIGNPPYVRQELLGKFKEYFESNYKVYNGIADLYSYFIERAVNLLKKDGYFSYIVSNKWIRANYGVQLREWVKKQNLLELIDFGDLPVFKQATTYPCILTITKNPFTEEFDFAKIPNLKFVDLLEEVNQNKFKINLKNLDSSGWKLVDDKTSKLLKKILSIGIPLTKYVNGKINRGIITGLNKAFVIDESLKNKLIDNDPNSKKLLKPFLIGRDIKRYSPLYKNKFLILIPRGFTKRFSNDLKNPWKWFNKEFPAIANHLIQFEIEAKKRYDKGDYWWELRACEYYDEFEKSKIIYPNICKRNEFTFDSNSFYTNQKCFIISVDDKYLLGLLNSSLFFFLFRSILPKLRGGFYEPGYVFLKDFPIVDADNEIKKLISTKVEEILKFNEEKQKVKIPQERTALQRQIEAADKQIDQLVYRLYGLTEEEIKIVGGET